MIAHDSDLVMVTCVFQQQAWNSSDVWLKPVSSVPIQVLIDTRKAPCLHPAAVLCLGGLGAHLQFVFLLDPFVPVMDLMP